MNPVDKRADGVDRPEDGDRGGEASDEHRIAEEPADRMGGESASTIRHGQLSVFLALIAVITEKNYCPIGSRSCGPARRTISHHLASRVGFEPTTKGLKVPCSATELPALAEA
jgi:hypothetical protein